MKLDAIVPENWLKRYLDFVEEKLRKAGYLVPETPFNHVFAAIAAAHIAGYDPVYDYVVEAYYELLDYIEEAEPLATPRWRKLFYELQDEVEALAAFEEALSSSELVFAAEPVLAGAVLAAATAMLEPPLAWFRAGLLRLPGQQVVVAKPRKKILVPRSLFILAASGLALKGVNPGSSKTLVVPDPAYVRKTVLDSHAPIEYLRDIVVEAISKYSSLAGGLENDLEKACRTPGVLVLRYTVASPASVAAEYVC